MIVAASVVESIELVGSPQRRSHPLLEALHRRRLPLMAWQTLGLQDLTPCQIPITRTEKKNLSTAIIEIATSIHPLKPIPRRPRIRHRLTLLKTLVIPIGTPSPVIIPIPVPCQMAIVQRDNITLQVEVVVLVVCLSAAVLVEARGRRRMTALLPR
jgi:hypothetical protein